jgi:hypothetical protein
MGLEGLGQLKNSMTSSEIEPATLRVVARMPVLSSHDRPPENTLFYLLGCDAELCLVA